jgi:hypothetical protein
MRRALIEREWSNQNPLKVSRPISWQIFSQEKGHYRTRTEKPIILEYSTTQAIDFYVLPHGWLYFATDRGKHAA